MSLGNQNHGISRIDTDFLKYEESWKRKRKRKIILTLIDADFGDLWVIFFLKSKEISCKNRHNVVKSVCWRNFNCKIDTYTKECCIKSSCQACLFIWLWQDGDNSSMFGTPILAASHRRHFCALGGP